MAGPTLAHADNVMVNSHYGFSYPATVVNPCNGEVVDVTFNLKGLVVITRDMAGGLHGHIHDTIQARGVGETTGVKYVEQPIRGAAGVDEPMTTTPGSPLRFAESHR